MITFKMEVPADCWSTDTFLILMSYDLYEKC